MVTRAALLIVAAAVSGCVGSGGEPGVAGTCQDALGARAPYANCRVVRGRLQLPHPSKLPGQTSAFQIAAVGFERKGGTAPPKTDGSGSDGSPGTSSATADWVLFTGDVFASDAGAGQGTSIPFSIVVPCQLSVNLLLQVPRAGGAAGYQVAQMAFAADSSGATSATTTLVPRQPANSCGKKTNSLDLAEVALTLAKDKDLSSGAIVLGQGKSKNPLSLLDTDNDQTADLADTDDDGDGLADISDDDAEGDGIKDAAQTLAALPDKDKDGVPDMFQ